MLDAAIGYIQNAHQKASRDARLAQADADAARAALTNEQSRADYHRELEAALAEVLRRLGAEPACGESVATTMTITANASGAD